MVAGSGGLPAPPAEGPLELEPRHGRHAPGSPLVRFAAGRAPDITAVARMLYASIVITHQTKGISRQVDAEYSRYSGKVSRKSFSS